MFDVKDGVVRHAANPRQPPQGVSAFFPQFSQFLCADMHTATRLPEVPTCIRRTSAYYLQNSHQRRCGAVASPCGPSGVSLGRGITRTGAIGRFWSVLAGFPGRGIKRLHGFRHVEQDGVFALQNRGARTRSRFLSALLACRRNCSGPRRGSCRACPGGRRTGALLEAAGFDVLPTVRRGDFV